MPEAGTIGTNLKRIRREHGLSQEALADKAGLSRDTIAKLEQGRRRGERTTTLMRLANALDVELTELTGKRERLGTDRDGGSVLAIRDAILSPSLLPGMPGLDPSDPGDPTPLPDLKAALERGWAKYWAGDFGGLVAAVPGLINEARLTHRSLGTAASGVLAQAYQLAACLMMHFGKADLAAIGAERGITVAAGGDDQLQWATLHGTYSWVLFHQARLDLAEKHALAIAEKIEPQFSKATPEHLTVWGGLVLTALAPAAAAGRGDEAREQLNLSRGAAAMMGRDRLDYNVNFGPTQVAMQSTHAHSVLKEPGQALKAAAGVRRQDLRPISYGAHLLDVAQAHADARQPRAAVMRLQEAQRMSPVWFRHQSIARSLVAEVRESATRPLPAIRTLATAVGLD